MFDFLKNVFGKFNFEPLIKEINSLETGLEKLDDKELKRKSLQLKEEIENGKSLDDSLVEAFALVREAAKRTLGQRHFDVQLMGGIILHQRKISEMATGEGKTLAATAPAYLNALIGKGVHVITVNDYLARRDTVWMGQIYHLLGLSIGCLSHQSAFIYDPSAKVEEQEDKERDILGSYKVMQDFLRPISRKEAYKCDILYGTNHEFGFDYLRDNLAYDASQQVQRTNFYYAIIDEIDSILIDEARTPLIIAAPDAESSEFYKIFARIVRNLKKEDDYVIDEKLKSVSITDEGISKVEKALNIGNLYSPEYLRLVHYLEESLKAFTLFQKDKNYIIEGDEIVIVDEFTGRKMYGRRYSGGLHQAIEAKEGVLVKQESRTYASITLQNYFRLYEKISGMTGTASTSAEEFHKVYGLDVVSIKTNKPMVRKDLSDAIYKNFEAKYRAVVEEIRKKHADGQPVLVGTASIDHNELLSNLLKQAGIPHEVLNAKNHEREGAIIAQAGKLKAVTVATNMAGRGVDIILGGNPPDSEEAKKVKELGGLCVIGTERHDARRVDNQLRGRAGRQGDLGESQFFLSLEDDLLRIFGGERIKNLMESFNLPEDAPIESRLVSKVVNEAQKKIEGINFDARKHLLEYDDVLNKQRSAIYHRRQEILESSKAEEEKQKNARILGILDMLWMNHLENMEALRESVRLRAYGQHDPLVEYRRESRKLYQQMLEDFEKMAENVEKIAETGGVSAPMPVNSAIKLSQDPKYKNVGRNDPCPCGSGKKFKKCHGA
ncbi:preprotein translocase subunit SecA [Candidatus Wolfebacteria bacterium RIFCSPLOWO2_01_FULL_38_11]|uniref:Protein translocase subunit SecA n=2 Tax=Candidatus Wolfeibacteriota TaxID=1752735 RepID=A0A0G0FT58_9BACT|nr:MAG: Protein translocase subunit SecA [Candidatus Wolfebacteria bacterium GW2011_GWC1_37_10]OGM90466.1 MAG: preprotein translocase subunit SecA [Candidatus Wolfebacteria bacterium RIFCSPLOWO2_01_FULL_38_11]